jgi:SAM-dependent methyltransferase
MTTLEQKPAVPAGAIEAVFGQVMGDFAAVVGVQTLVLGITSGAWKALAGAGPTTPAELATRIGTVEPYAREWLAAQAAAGYVTYDPTTGTFTLPPATTAVLADDEQTALFLAFGEAMDVMANDFARFRDRFASGQGFGWHERSPGHWEAMARINAATVLPFLPSWIAGTSVADRLAAGGRIADIGSGYGAVAIALSEAHPEAAVYGFDYHDGSVARSREAAAAAGVGARTRFEVATAKDFPGADYDIVLFVDSFHDLGDPVGALVHARSTLAPGGVVLLVEMACADRLEDNLNPMGRMFYSISTTVCTANGVAQEGHPLGTVAGEARLREVAAAAGFSDVRRLDVEAPLNILLELRP